MENKPQKDIFEDMRPKLKPIENSDRRKRLYVIQLNKMLVEHFKKGNNLNDSIGLNQYGELVELSIEDEQTKKKYDLFKTQCKDPIFILKQTNQAFKNYGKSEMYLKPIVRRNDIIIKQQKPKLVINDESSEDEIPHKPINIYRKREDIIVDKRVRMNETELTDRILAMFKIKPTYTFNMLNLELKQPEQYLKEQLKKICDLVQSPTSSMKEYQLKKDYQ
ncbi:hypothetical protein ENUP19_0256G0009 [Entamoeba nuttalli]|uniref:TFIIF beta subunit HTH domain-containing protein n=2 Tax=Entamoeba nuttalli TaxID=412467 RepID=K2HUT6_ENTNP|nr:hypothetical protein ENU1_107980 [Entamoeba nuttalli P19]EKE39965.1 hypothetical protein ENU1_107980 [Entamoeba nuttalli P19]|eukprot:XP_008857699.1 hypothetical protein ENU1_107980 [Entamoeba nuttalli P19]